jgi:hypothetical protein
VDLVVPSHRLSVSIVARVGRPDGGEGSRRLGSIRREWGVWVRIERGGGGLDLWGFGGGVFGLNFGSWFLFVVFGDVVLNLVGEKLVDRRKLSR